MPLAHRQAEPLLGRAGGSEMLVRVARGAEMKLHAITGAVAESVIPASFVYDADQVLMLLFSDRRGPVQAADP